MGMLPFWIDKTNHFDASRTQGVGDVLAGVLRPADDINFFASEFIHNLLNARAPGSDAGSNGIDFSLDAVDSHLGPRSYRPRRRIGFTGNSNDAYRALLYLRNFIFKEIDHQSCVSSTHKQLRTTARNFADLFKEDFEGGVGAIVVVWKLIAPGQFSFYLWTAKTRTHSHDDRLTLESNHACREDWILKISEFLLDHSSLLISQLLSQDLFGRGGCHATEILLLGSDIQNDGVAGLGIFSNLHHLGQGDLVVFTFNVINDDFAGENPVALFV